VNVGMTACTIARQAKVRSPGYHLRILEDIRRPDFLFRMALPAFNGPVLPLKDKACRTMVKGLCIEAEELEFSAVMLLVALRAWFLRDPGMKPFARVDPGAELGVTVEAAGSRDRFAQRMAARAVPDSLQVCMRRREFSRRNLRVRHRRSGKSRNNQQPNNGMDDPARHLTRSIDSRKQSPHRRVSAGSRT
jgi:hypothetical protein